MKKAIILILTCLFIVIIASCHKDEPTVKDEKSHLRQKIIGKANFELAKIKDPKTGLVPVDKLQKAYKFTQEKLRKKDAISGISWEERGPSNISGRTKTILIDSRDASGNTIWTGGVSGGIWKSTNGGTSWTIISDQFNNMSVTTIVQDPNNANIIYFGTGEGHVFTSGIKGNGIYKSTNGGISFSPIAFTINNPDFEFVNKLAIHSYNGQTHLYAATSSSNLTRGGLLITQDGGSNWLIWRGNNTGTNNFACDVEITAPDPQNGNNSAVIAAFGGIGNELAAIAGGSTESDGIYVSLDGGNNWFQEYVSNSNDGRIEVATSSTDPFIRYLLIESKDPNLLASMFGRAFVGINYQYVPITMPVQGWKDFDCNQPVPDIFRTQDFYDLALAVSPSNPYRVMVGAVDLWLYERNPTIFSDTWAQVSHWLGNCNLPLVHADQHYIIYENSNEAYIANDGGIWKTDNANATTALPSFSFRGNTLNITQFFACDIHPSAATNQYLGGTQDNGSQFFTSAGINATIDVSGGDGGFSHIDQDNPSIQITSNTMQNYSVTNTGWSTGQPDKRVNTTGGRFINPTDYDDNANKLYCSNGTGNFTRWEDPATLGQTLTTVTVNGFPDIQDGGAWHIRVSPNITNRVYFGFGNGVVVKVDNANTGTSKTGQVIFDQQLGAGSIISCVEIQPGNENHMLITLSNYGVTSVYESFNANTANPSWSAVEGNLPDMPVRWAMLNPNNSDQAFLATDLGIWSTTNLNGNATDWDPTNVGLSNTRIDMIKYRPSDNQMVVATHGRGLFTSDDLGSSGNCSNNLTFSSETISGTQSASQSITMTNTTIIGSATVNAPNVNIFPQFTVNSQSSFQIDNTGCN